MTSEQYIKALIGNCEVAERDEYSDIIRMKIDQKKLKRWMDDVIYDLTLNTPNKGEESV